MNSTVILIVYPFSCPHAGQAFHFFLDKKTKQIKIFKVWNNNLIEPKSY